MATQLCEIDTNKAPNDGPRMKPSAAPAESADQENSTANAEPVLLSFFDEPAAKQDSEEALMSGGGSLQANFAKFRQEKVKLAKMERKNKFAADKKRAEPGAMDRLRTKFLEQCFKYAGVPYHRKYHEDPTSEHHGAPLYLDCCGLIRQVVIDLKEDFGFTQGKWNQTYQYDTLRSSEVQSHEQLEPGDLVFIKGDYYSDSKPQKYGIVHVEVFLGDSEWAGEHRATGEATIGARWQKGIVQVFPSYSFDAKSYKIEEFIFCKLDPWLKG